MYVPKGCPQCRGAGYVGRTAIHELLALDEDMHTAIGRGADAVTLQEVARRNGMLTLFEDGLRKVASGETSFEEVLRVTQDQIDD
jgi:general secretion pathway protein E